MSTQVKQKTETCIWCDSEAKESFEVENQILENIVAEVHVCSDHIEQLEAFEHGRCSLCMNMDDALIPVDNDNIEIGRVGLCESHFEPIRKQLSDMP